MQSPLQHSRDRTYKCQPDNQTQIEYWTARASALGYGDHPNLERAVERLAAGDVSDTQYGVRVALRSGWDHRAKAKAYWPRQNGSCRCRANIQTAFCSHVLAAFIFRGEDCATVAARRIEAYPDEEAIYLDTCERIAYANGFRQ
jgi:hypothetical protein